MRFGLRALCVFTLVAIAAPAQWLHYPTPGMPRTKDGKPNLSAPVPKGIGGHPDLSGVWLAPDNDFFLSLTAHEKGDRVPYQPWAKALVDERQARDHRDDPLALCLPPGVPRIDYNLYHPFKIVTTPRETILLYETSANDEFREVFTDGRPLPKDPQPSWKGYSIGQWQGDVFVVNTLGFNDRGWLDTAMGRPQTEALHVTERFRRTNFSTLEIAITIDDPKAYTQPWDTKLILRLQPDTELLESVCENQKGFEHR